MFRNAIKLDPNYARAYAYLALSIFVQIFYAYTGNDDVDEALATAWKAVSLDGDEPLAHAGVGLVQFTKRRDEEAIASLERAIALNPNDPQLSQSLGFVLTYVGRPEEGSERLWTAHHLNPREDQTVLGISLYLGKRYEEAIRVFTEGPASRWGLLYLAAANGQIGHLDAAESALQRFISNMQAEFRARGESIPTALDLVQMDLNDLRRQTDRQHLLDGLRKAGLPE